MHKCQYEYTHTHIITYILAYMQTHTYTHSNAQTCTNIHNRTSKYVCTHACIITHNATCRQIHACIIAHTPLTRTHTRTHMHLGEQHLRTYVSADLCPLVFYLHMSTRRLHYTYLFLHVHTLSPHAGIHMQRQAYLHAHALAPTHVHTNSH